MPFLPQPETPPLTLSQFHMWNEVSVTLTLHYEHGFITNNTVQVGLAIILKSSNTLDTKSGEMFYLQIIAKLALFQSECLSNSLQKPLFIKYTVHFT